MFKRFSAFIESLLPAGYFKNAELYRQGIIFAWICIAAIPLVLGMGVLDLVYLKYDNSYIGPLFILFFLVLLVLLKKGASILILSNVFLIVSYSVFFATTYNMGLYAPTLPFAIIFPLVALIIGGRKSVLVWLGIVFISLIAIYIKSLKTGMIMPDTGGTDPIAYLFYLLSATVFLFAFLLFSEQSRRKAQLLLIKEKERSDILLKNILPYDIAEELKEKGKTQARYFEEVTVLFTDFVDFTKVSEILSPQELVTELDTCFEAFDTILDKYGIEKIKTIGDAYLAVSGLPATNAKHAENMINAALEIRDYMEQRIYQMGNRTFRIRMGIDTGSVVAGIVGIRKFAYDIWGDTVNTAARMEQNSEPGRINISKETFNKVNHLFTCAYRGKVQAKNKGEIEMYFVESKA